MSNLIDRQQAIDALKEAFNPSITNFVKAKMAIDNLPSAQPEKRTEERTETHACDSISRQAAIDAFNTNLNELVVGGEENAKTVENYLNRVLDKIKCLPSALGTNLAEVGTDTISRQAAINKILGQPPEPHYPSWYAEQIKELPPAQPEIIRCKDCVHADYKNIVKALWCSECGQGKTVAPNDFCSYAER